MKNLFASKKFLIGLGIFIVVIIIFLSTGILKFEASFKRNSETSSPADSTQGSPEVTSQQIKLASRATEFSDKQGSATFSIKLPLGWSTAEDARVNLVAGSLTPEKLTNGQEFTVNLNAIIAPHESLKTFADYQASWKEQTLAQYPSMELISDGSEKINEMDVYVLEVKNSRPDGTALHQLQYVFYVDENMALVLTGTTPDDSWGKYESVLKESFNSLEKVTPQ